MKISFYSKKLKTEQKMPNFTKWPNMFFHVQRISKMAKFFKTGNQMAW